MGKFPQRKPIVSARTARVIDLCAKQALSEKAGGSKEMNNRIEMVGMIGSPRHPFSQDNPKARPQIWGYREPTLPKPTPAEYP